jgi:PAS domain S-box-containing protein
MAASSALRSLVDVESFIYEYFEAWGGIDEDRIMCYYADNVTVQIPGTLMQGSLAVREQFVRPFIAGFPGNRHTVKNWIFGRDVVVVEWSFEAEHRGPFAGRAATNACVEVPGCGVYEYDSAKRQITAARIYFDVGTLLKQIVDQGEPRAKTEEAPPAPVGAMVEHLDLATVLAVSQTVSGEMVLEKLLDTLMRAAVEHAQAERALLILSREAEQRIAAEATSTIDALMVRLCDEPVTGFLLPETVLRYVLHTGENVILDDAGLPNPFSTDPYIARRHARSVFCLPLMNQAKFIGALYLENNLAPRVFARARTAVLKLLASQAAISLENSRLYRDLAERESRIRRLVDANIVGIFVWELEGRILEANDAFLTMVGHSREDLAAGGMSWTGLTPSEWRDRDEQLMPELAASGTLQPFEKEYFRKDGSRVPVLIGVASFDEIGNQGVAFVLDLTERKRAQDALDRARAELARVSRVTALSALTASIAHEVNQPLSGIITNAGTCLRMLDATPPDIDGARETARRTLRDGNRASEVVTRLRALFSKRELTLEPLDLNEAAREVIALSASDLQRNRIALESRLGDNLPVVAGDRIQLQQVILNLLRNASDAMAEVQDRPRQLLITTEREQHGAHVRLSVRDTGLGLSPEVLGLLFNAFHTTKSGGMGIGLFVSRSIIERHDGRLWAESNQGAPGATFSFSIPHGAPRDSGPASASSASLRASPGS